MSLLNLVAKLTLDTSEYESSVGKAEKSAGGFGDAFKKVADLGVKAFTAATAAVGAFTVASVKTGMDFDKSMSQVYATMGDKANEMVEYNGKTVSSMEALRDFAQQMGATTQYSAKESADALNYMALAGYDAQLSMQMLPNVMNLAAAGAFDLARASDMITDTQTAFGISTERTTQMVDEMAKAASTGNTSVEQLGDAFLVVGGLAKELNGGFVTLADGTKEPVDGIQEMEIALTAMANAGVKGSSAGTHMRNMIMELSSPAKEGAKQMEALGVKVFDAEGNMRSLQDIMGDLNGALGNLTQEQKIQAISDLFNARDLASAEALLGAVEQDWNKIGESIINAEGAAEEMAKTQLDNLAGDMTIFKSSVEGAQIAISDVLTPSIREFVQTGTAGVSEFTQKMRSGDVIGAIESIGNTIGQLATEVVKKVPDMVMAGATLLKGLGEGVASAVSQIDFKGSIVPLIVKFASGIRSSAGSLTKASIELIKGLSNGISDNSSFIIITGKQILTDLVGAITDNVPTLFQAGLEMLTGLGESIGGAIPSFLETTALPLLLQFSETLRSGAGQFVDAGINFILNIAQGIMDSLPTLIEQVPQIVINIAGVINDNAPKLISGGIKLIEMIAAGIINAIPTLIANIPKIFEMILAVWQALNWLNLGKNVINFIRNGFDMLKTQLPEKLREIGQNAIEWLKGIDWAGTGRAIINFIKTAVISVANLIPNALKTIGSTAIGWFKGVNWAGAGTAVISFIVAAITSLATDIPNKLKSIGEKAWDSFKSINWFDLGSNVISGIVDGLSAGVDWIKDKARSVAESALNAAKNVLGIESPSKVFRDEVGKMITAGLSIGIDDGALDAIESAEKLSSGILRPFDDIGTLGVSASGSSFSGSIMSAIRANNESLINGMYMAMSTALREADITVEISGREFHRTLREAGAL